jgi:hypothetical protein
MSVLASSSFNATVDVAFYSAENAFHSYQSPQLNMSR